MRGPPGSLKTVDSFHMESIYQIAISILEYQIFFAPNFYQAKSYYKSNDGCEQLRVMNLSLNAAMQMNGLENSRDPGQDWGAR